jgi:hypothetical protein
VATRSAVGGGGGGAAVVGGGGGGAVAVVGSAAVAIIAFVIMLTARTRQGRGSVLLCLRFNCTPDVFIRYEEMTFAHQYADWPQFRICRRFRRLW